MTGEELKKFRKEYLQMTAEQLAAELSVAANTVSRWERGELPFPPYLQLALERIADKTIESKARAKVAAVTGRDVKEFADRGRKAQAAVNAIVKKGKNGKRKV